MATHEIGTVPDRWNITHLAGQRFEVTIPVLDGAPAPVDASDLLRGRVHVRPFVDAENVLHVFDTESDPPNAEIVGGASAALVITATADETSAWTLLWPGSNGQAVVWWDVEVVDTTGEPHQLTRPGTITLVHEVTR